MKKTALLLSFLIFFSLSASASYISLNTTVTSKVSGNNLRVEISAINKGDEAAHNVQAEVRVGDKKILASKKHELGINQTYKAFADFRLGFKSPGQYPLIVILHYADANQYPFSALTCQTYSYKAEDLPSEIFGSLKSISFWEKGKTKLTLKNMGDSEKVASTYLVVPRELSIERKSYEMVIPPKSKAEKSFMIENFSALGGSSYQVFAISEFEEEGIHQTSIIPGMIKIVERRTFLGIDYVYLIVVLIVLVVLFVVFQLRLPLFKK